MPPFAGPRLAREPSPRSNGSADTSLVCCKHIQIEHSFARVFPLLISSSNSNSPADVPRLLNQQNPAFLLDG